MPPRAGMQTTREKHQKNLNQKFVGGRIMRVSTAHVDGRCKCRAVDMPSGETINATVFVIEQVVSGQTVKDVWCEVCGMSDATALASAIHQMWAQDDAGQRTVGLQVP